MNEYEVLIETINPCGGERTPAKSSKKSKPKVRKPMSLQMAASPFWTAEKMHPGAPSL